MYYFGARYYDPKTSVWVSADPIDRFNTQSPPLGLNLYQYALWNPVRLIDPNGTLEYDTQQNQYRIEKGDTLTTIGKDMGFSVDQLMSENPGIKDKNKIYAGDTINIPQNVRIKTFQNAAKNLESPVYDFDAVQGGGFDAGTNKCNLFVSNMMKEAGGTPPTHQRSALGKFLAGESRGPASANLLASNSLLVGPLMKIDEGQALPGDTLAFPGGTDSGHAAIFTGNIGIKKDGKIYRDGTISASPIGVVSRSVKHLKNVLGSSPTYRRYQE